MIHWDQQEISLNNLYEQSCVVSAMAVLCKDAQLHYVASTTPNVAACSQISY